MTYEGMLAETVAFRGHGGDIGEAYYARPLGAGPWPGVVLIHHMPGWDWWIKEATRKLAYHGAVDDSRDDAAVTTHYLRDALDAVLAGKEPPVAETPAVGCTVKWRA